MATREIYQLTKSVWTPTISFVTPGDLSVVYSSRYGFYRVIDNVVDLWFNIITSTFTHTTASGTLTVSGAPYSATSETGNHNHGPLTWQGITKAGYTQINARIASTAVVSFPASGSGVSYSDVSAADTTTGVNLVLQGYLSYRK